MSVSYLNTHTCWRERERLLLRERERERESREREIFNLLENWYSIIRSNILYIYTVQSIIISHIVWEREREKRKNEREKRKNDIERLLLREREREREREIFNLLENWYNIINSNISFTIVQFNNIHQYSSSFLILWEREIETRKNDIERFWSGRERE